MSCARHAGWVTRSVVTGYVLLAEHAPPLSLRGTFAPVRGKVHVVITPHWLETLGFATQVFGLRLSIPVEARGFAEDKHLRAEAKRRRNPALTQINARNAAICDGGNVRRGRLNPLKNGSRLSERPTTKSLL